MEEGKKKSRKKRDAREGDKETNVPPRERRTNGSRDIVSSYRLQVFCAFRARAKCLLTSYVWCHARDRLRL